MVTPNNPSNETRPLADSLVHPLERFYARSGTQLPPLDRIDGEDLPAPYRTLLVHRNDMTSTLENFHGQSVYLRVLGREQRGDDYYREVVLCLEGSDKPVEFGAIKIDLSRFTEKARNEILTEHWPLGHILREYRIPYTSNPKAFLRVASDGLINSVLQLSGAHLLYGRRNTLAALSGASLAEIVEIVPPISRGV